MIILIGGTGFIGKHVLCALDSLEIPNTTFSKNPNLDFIETHTSFSKGFNISNLQQDVCRDQIVNAKAVIYLASSSIPASEKFSLNQEIENNLRSAINTLEYISSLNPSIRIIYLSSGGTVYGPGHNTPIKEHFNLNPITPYAYGKIAIENYLQFLGNTTDVSYTILRASNPVGKWHANLKQGFIGAAIAKAKAKEAIQIYGNGETIRDYLDADELADALTQVLSNLAVSKNKIWNIGTGIGTSLNQIITILQKNLDYELTVEHLTSRNTDLDYNVLNCAQINAELGWSAKLTINEIIKKAWQQSTTA